MELTIKNRSSASLAWLSCLLLLLQFSHVTESASSLEKDLTLTYSQKVALDKFTHKMANRVPHAYMREPIYLIRWLRARNFNIEQAEQMLNENLKWRKVNKIDTILKEDWSEMHDRFPYFLDTHSKDGKPILSGNFGEWDIRQMAIAGQMPKLIRYLDKGMEDAVTTVRKFQDQGRNVSQFDFLVNMDNYNVVQHGCIQCINFYLALINSYESHFAGFADHIILFKTPPVFEVVLRVIRPLMSPITRNALKVYGQDKTQWTKALWDIADRSQLTPEYGGTYKRED